MTPDCPHCDSAQPVERLGGGYCVCPSCSKTFQIPARVSPLGSVVTPAAEGETAGGTPPRRC